MEKSLKEIKCPNLDKSGEDNAFKTTQKSKGRRRKASAGS